MPDAPDGHHSRPLPAVCLDLQGWLANCRHHTVAFRWAMYFKDNKNHIPSNPSSKSWSMSWHLIVMALICLDTMCSHTVGELMGAVTTSMVWWTCTDALWVCCWNVQWYSDCYSWESSRTWPFNKGIKKHGSAACDARMVAGWDTAEKKPKRFMPKPLLERSCELHIAI